MEPHLPGVLAFFDGLPIVPQIQQLALKQFLLSQLGQCALNDHSEIYLPLDRHSMSVGVAVVRFATSHEADRAIQRLHNTAIDRNHTIALERVEGWQRFAGVEAHGIIDYPLINQLPALSGMSLQREASTSGIQGP